VRVLGLLGLLVALALILAVSAATYLRTPSGLNYNAAPRAAGHAAGAAETHVREVVKVPAAP